MGYLFLEHIVLALVTLTFRILPQRVLDFFYTEKVAFVFPKELDSRLAIDREISSSPTGGEHEWKARMFLNTTELIEMMVSHN